MWVVEDKFKVKLGGTYYINVPILIEYNGEQLFELSRADNTGLLGISFDIYDKKGAKIAVVKQGRIYQGNTSAYSVNVAANQYTLTELATGRVICDIKKRALAHPAELDISVTMYMKDGFLLEATPTKTNILGATIIGGTIEGARIGLSISKQK